MMRSQYSNLPARKLAGTDSASMVSQSTGTMPSCKPNEQPEAIALHNGGHDD